MIDTIFHISPYLRPDIGRWNGTSNTLRQIGTDDHTLTHFIIVCSPSAEKTKLNDNTWLWAVPIPNIEKHSTVREIIKHSEVFVKNFHTLFGTSFNNEFRDALFIAHGPEALFFADILLGHFKIESHQFCFQTHYGIWEICNLINEDMTWCDFSPDLDNLMLRSDFCIEILNRAKTIWVENSLMKDALLNENINSNCDLQISPLVGYPKVFSLNEKPIQNKKILIAGRCSYEKGFDIAIRAFDIAKRKHPSVRDYTLECILMERWPFPYAHQKRYKEYLLQLADSLKSHASISFRGALGHSQLLSEIRNCALLLVPSRYEPFGIVALEGVLQATKTLASPLVGATEHINSIYLKTTGTTTPETFASAIVRELEKDLIDKDSFEWPSVDLVLNKRFKSAFNEKIKI